MRRGMRGVERSTVGREVGQQGTPGRGRGRSDDRVRVVWPANPAGPVRDGVFALVVDGEGTGELGGAVADLVARAITDAFLAAGPAHTTAARLTGALREGVWAIRDRMASDATWSDARATVLAAVAAKGRLTVANVGAGRAYLVGSRVRRVTRDHTVVADQIRDGLLTEADAKDHPYRHLITRYFAGDFDVDIDVFDVALRPAETVVLCSDGVPAVVDDEEIGRAVGRRAAADAANALIGLARERDAPDDASAIVIGPAPSARGTGGLGLPHRRSLLMLAGGFALVAAIAAVQLGRGSPAPAPRAAATMPVEDAPVEEAPDAAPMPTATPNPTTAVLTATVRPATPTPTLPPPPPVSFVRAALGSFATPTATVTETSPPVPSASSTAEPTTATAIPTGSPSPTSGPKIATSTPRPSPRPTAPVATATPAHPPPVLNPAVAGGGAIVLSWGYGGQLAADEYFDVRVWASGQAPAGIANVKQTSYAIGAGFPAGTYNWTIAVVRRAGGGPTQTLVAAGETLTFTWAGAGPSGGPCPRGSNPGCG